MNATVQDLAARYSALPESIRSKCPRPTVAVTPEKVRGWLIELRDTCLAAAATATDLALDTARASVHATFGLINSTPRSSRVPVEEMRALLTEMALRALDA